MVNKISRNLTLDGDNHETRVRVTTADDNHCDE